MRSNNDNSIYTEILKQTNLPHLSCHVEGDSYCSIALQMEHCFLAIALNLKWEF